MMEWIYGKMILLLTLSLLYDLVVSIIEGYRLLFGKEKNNG